MARLRRLLQEELRGQGSRRRDALSILNLACGACDEAETLSQAAAGALSDPAASTLLVGVDIRGRELDEARERFRSSSRHRFEFLREDASRLDRHRELPEQFDLVFFRHQNLYHGRDLWRRIFQQGLERVSEDGLLVVTSYFDREHQLALEAFQELGAEVLSTRQNEESRALDWPGKSVDRHVAVLRRPR